MAHHGWSWLTVGRLDLMGWLGWIRWWLGWLRWLLGWFSWWVCGLVELKDMDLSGCLWLDSGFGYESQWFGYGGLVVTVV